VPQFHVCLLVSESHFGFAGVAGRRILLRMRCKTLSIGGHAIAYVRSCQ
jgi:hypothetical protein